METIDERGRGKMKMRKILGEYLGTVGKLYGTPSKAFLNVVMVTGFYFVYDVALRASGAYAYIIYHVSIPPSLLFIFNSIIFPILSYVIGFQLLSIFLGFVLWAYNNDKKQKGRLNDKKNTR